MTCSPRLQRSAMSPCRATFLNALHLCRLKEGNKEKKRVKYKTECEKRKMATRQCITFANHSASRCPNIAEAPIMLVMYYTKRPAQEWKKEEWRSNGSHT